VTGGNPWADPSTPTEPGEPYAGPPAPVPGGYGAPPAGYGVPPGYGAPAPGYGYPAPYGYGQPYGYPYPAPYPGAWWPPVPAGPRKPGQVIASAVLAFVQAGLVLFATLYVWFVASVLGLAAQGSSLPTALRGFGSEVTVVAILQLLSVALLVAGGIRGLMRRTRNAWLLLLVSLGVQLAFCVYWAFRLIALFDAIPGPDPGGTFAAFTVLFAAMPLVGIGLVAVGAGKRWFQPEATA
jgi:hypothetical protein